MKEHFVPIISGIVAFIVAQMIWNWGVKRNKNQIRRWLKNDALKWTASSLFAVIVGVVAIEVHDSLFRPPLPVGVKESLTRTNTPPPPDSALIPSLQLEIRITIVPPVGSGPGQMEDIGGEVRGLEGLSAYTNYAVVVYSYTKNPPGRDSWFVQPTFEVSLTPIGSDGKWNNRIYLGSKYAAILVKKPYTASPTLPALPVKSESIPAITEVEGSK